MHFGEYELFPSLIGLSPLPTSHPKTFQRQRVRSSSVYYHSFNLLMGRSLGFASNPSDSCALFRLAFASATALNALTSPDTLTRRFIMQKARRHPKGAPTACRHMVSGSLSPFYSKCFSPFPHGTGSLSVSKEYLALPDGPGGFSQGFPCPDLLRILLKMIRTYPYETFTLCGCAFQRIPIRRTFYVAVLLPRLVRKRAGLGCSAFARRY